VPPRRQQNPAYLSEFRPVNNKNRLDRIGKNVVDRTNFVSAFEIEGRPVEDSNNAHGETVMPMPHRAGWDATFSACGI
jgi:hypothetical protein